MRDRIKQIRNAKHLTQSEFGELIGVKGSTVTGYETGNRTPNNAVILSICREFRVNETWLRTGEGEMFIRDPDSELEELAARYGLSKRDKALVKSYMELSESQRAAVTQFLFNMVEKAKKEEEAAAEPSIDELVADYRRQLEEERASRGKNTVPGKVSDSNAS